MNPNLMEQFLGPSTQFFRFNANDINVLVTPIEKKTCLLTKRNGFMPSTPPPPPPQSDDDTQADKKGGGGGDSSLSSSSTTRIRFSPNTNGGASTRPDLGPNTVIKNTNRYNQGSSSGSSKNGGSGLRTSSSGSSLLLRKSSRNNHDYSSKSTENQHFLDLSPTTSLQDDCKFNII